MSHLPVLVSQPGPPGTGEQLRPVGGLRSRSVVATADFPPLPRKPGGSTVSGPALEFSCTEEGTLGQVDSPQPEGEAATPSLWS